MGRRVKKYLTKLRFEVGLELTTGKVNQSELSSAIRSAVQSAGIQDAVPESVRVQCVKKVTEEELMVPP